MTKDGAKISETDYRFDNLVLKLGKHYNLKYYTRYGWESSAGARIENSTGATDYLISNTEEYNIIIRKGAELGEEHLKNYSQADRHRKLYKEERARYVFDHPSQSLLLIQDYYTI